MDYISNLANLNVSLIACMARNRVIGDNGKMPWHIPGELALFKKYTTGKAVVMGRKTWDSLPEKYRPLPDRLNFVITRDTEYTREGCVEASSIDEAILLSRMVQGIDETVIIGGQSIYEQAIDLADTLYLTELDAILPGDTYFPKFDREEFKVEEETYYQPADDQPMGYWFRVYKRK